VTPGHSQAGFTLLETLVAVTLLALLYGALMPVFQQGLSALRSADRYSRAVLLAQSVLEREAVDPAGEAGESDDGVYRWTVSREPYAPEDSGPALTGEGILRLVQVAVTVTWPGNDVGLRLATLVVEPAP